MCNASVVTPSEVERIQCGTMRDMGLRQDPTPGPQGNSHSCQVVPQRTSGRRSSRNHQQGCPCQLAVVLKTLETRGEHQNRWHMGVHPPNGGIGFWPMANSAERIRWREERAEAQTNVQDRLPGMAQAACHVASSMINPMKPWRVPQTSLPLVGRAQLKHFGAKIVSTGCLV